MSEFSLKTKLFLYRNKYFIPFQLSDNSMLLYSSNEILKLNKNLSSYNFNLVSKYKNIFNFEIEEEMPNKIRKIIQIKNKILVCDNNLYIYDIDPKNNNPKKYPNNLSLVDIVKLKNGKLLGISKKNLYLINIEEILSELELNNKIKKHHEKIYKYPSECHIKPTLKKFEEFVNGYLLKDNKIILHFNSEEVEKHGGCITVRYKRVFGNKIYIFNMDNSELIHKFDEFNGKINIAISNAYISLGFKNKILIYDINDYKLIKEIDIKSNIHSMIIYSENLIMSIYDSILWYGGVIFLYDISNINDIKYYILDTKFIKHAYRGILYKLKNGNILLISFEYMNILEISKKINLLSFESLSEYNSSFEKFKKYKKNYING